MKLCFLFQNQLSCHLLIVLIRENDYKSLSGINKIEESLYQINRQLRGTSG